MKVLITGGAGYIGSHTIIELISALPKTEIISIDNFCNSTPETFIRIEKITGRKIVNHQIDLTDINAVHKFFSTNSDINSIIHFAALKAVGESVEKPLLYFENNNGSLLNLLKCVEEFNIPNFIFSSSCTVYGTVEKLPVTENTPLQKTESPYGHTKIVGEELLQNFQKASSKFNCVLLRYFNPVGAHISGLIGELPLNKPNNLVPLITGNAIGKYGSLTVFGTDYNTRDGSCIRDYVHVSDIANAHVKALIYLQGKKNSETFIFNLGTGNGVTVLELIDAFEKNTGIKLNYHLGDRRSGDVSAIYANNSKAKAELNWIPKYSVSDMMTSAWKWEQHISDTV